MQFHEIFKKNFFLADEINKVLKATFAKAMANNPNAAADMARCMAEAMAASGASAEEIAATMQEALNSSLCNIDLDHLDELLDVADTVARSMADAGASPQEIAAAMKAAFKVIIVTNNFSCFVNNVTRIIFFVYKKYRLLAMLTIHLWQKNWPFPWQKLWRVLEHLQRK